MIYRRKPEIAQIKVLTLANREQVRAWIKLELFSEGVDFTDLGLILKGPRKELHVWWGDYIVKECNGSFYSYTPHEFKDLYERCLPDRP